MMNQFFESMQNQAAQKKEDSSPGLSSIITADALKKLIENDPDGSVKNALIP